MIDQNEVDRLEQAVTDAAAARELTREDVAAIVRDYGDYIGVEDLALDETGSAALNVEEEIDIALVHLPQFPGIVVAAEMDNDVDALESGGIEFAGGGIPIGRIGADLDTPTDETDHVVAGFGIALNDNGSDKPTRTGNEDFHATGPPVSNDAKRSCRDSK